MTAGLAVALLVLGALASMAGAQEADPTVERPPLWQSTSSASAVHLTLNTDPPLLPFDGLVRLDLPEGFSTWSHTGVSRARASDLWPGVVGAQGLGLMCEFQEGACPEGFPPRYPFSATATHPRQPEAQTGTGGAEAYAGRDYVETEAATSRLIPLLEALGVVSDVGTIEAVTRQEFVDEGQEIVSSAFARLQDVGLVGGLVNVDVLEVRSVSRSRGGGETVNNSAVNIAGLTIEGQEISLGSEGLTLAGEGGGHEQVDEINQRLEEALADTPFEVRLLGVQESLDDQVAASQAGGLLINFEVELEDPIGIGDLLPVRVNDVPLPDQLPVPEPETAFTTYVGSLVLGNTGSRAYVSQEGFSFDGFDGFDGGEDLGGVGETAGPDEFTSPDGGVESSSGDFDDAPDDTASTPVVADPPDTEDTTSADTPQVASPSDEGVAAGDQGGERNLQALMLGSDEADGIADLFFALGILCAVLFVLGRFSLGVLTRDLAKETLDAG